MSDELELINQARLGNDEAFCSLARAYQRRIYSLALHYARDPHDAEDLSQEVWLKAYRSIGEFRGESSFYTWLRQITINALINRQRKWSLTFWKRRASLHDEEFASLTQECAAAPYQCEEGLQRKMLVAQVMHALGSLSSRERLIFLLKHHEGMTYDEIAAACETSSGTIKKALFRVMTKLRERLGAATDSERQASSVASRIF